LRSTDNDSDDGTHEHERNVHMSYHVSINGIDCGWASGEPDSNPLVCSKQGDEEPQADREGNVTIDLVDYEVDPYEAAMHDHPDGGADSFFRSEHHNGRPNIPHDEVSILFTCLINLRQLISLSSVFFRHTCPLP
jgi:hypothetical protein